MKSTSIATVVTLSPLFLSGAGWRGKAAQAALSLLSPIRPNVLATNDTNRTPRLMSEARRPWRRAFKALMRSQHLKIPKYNLPLRFRPVSRPPHPFPRSTHVSNHFIFYDSGSSR